MKSLPSLAVQTTARSLSQEWTSQVTIATLTDTNVPLPRSQSLSYRLKEFNGRSDYGPFIEPGVDVPGRVVSVTKGGWSITSLEQSKKGVFFKIKYVGWPELDCNVKRLTSLCYLAVD